MGIFPLIILYIVFISKTKYDQEKNFLAYLLLLMGVSSWRLDTIIYKFPPTHWSE